MNLWSGSGGVYSHESVTDTKNGLCALLPSWIWFVGFRITRGRGDLAVVANTCHITRAVKILTLKKHRGRGDGTGGGLTGDWLIDMMGIDLWVRLRFQGLSKIATRNSCPQNQVDSDSICNPLCAWCRRLNADGQRMRS